MPAVEFVCNLCPHGCGVRRSEQAGDGICASKSTVRVARAALHYWEEPCISGTRGSGTVFFSGCPLHCVYCQNDSVSRKNYGADISLQRLGEIFRELESQGAHNINLVNPTHYAYAVRKVLEQSPPGIPVVYNSGGYDRIETLRSLEGLVDIYLPDLKYVSPNLSARYSGAADYFSAASVAVLEMARQTGPAVFDKDGLLLSGTIVRHLILPNQVENSLEVLRWCKEHLPEGTLVSVMAQYTPCGRAAEFPELNRRITKREYERVLDALFELGLTEGFVQERSSAKEEYIPPFDLSGVLTEGGKNNGTEGIPGRKN